MRGGSSTRMNNANGIGPNVKIFLKSHQKSNFIQKSYSLSVVCLSSDKGTHRSIRKSIDRNWTVWTHFPSRKTTIRKELDSIVAMRDPIHIFDDRAWIRVASLSIFAWSCAVKFLLCSLCLKLKFYDRGNIKFIWDGKSSFSMNGKLWNSPKGINKSSSKTDLCSLYK